MLRQMKTVHQKVEVNEYLIDGGLNLTKQYDRFVRRIETRSRIEKDRGTIGGCRLPIGGLHIPARSVIAGLWISAGVTATRPIPA